jgi:hypothetical protein
MRKLLVLLISLASLLLLGAPAIHAQEATATSDTGWPAEKRCVGAPTKAPKGWSYDGTILMTGYAGIHGVNAKWDTPHVLVFLGDNDLWGGALSLDGKWYASPYGDRIPPEVSSTTTQTKEIRIYNLTIQSQPIIIRPVESYSRGGDYTSIYWQGNDSIIYRTDDGTQSINRLTQEKTTLKQFDGLYDGEDIRRFSFSPNLSYVIYHKFEPHEPGDAVIRDLRTQNDIKQLKIKNPITWNPNSSEFTAILGDNIGYGRGKLEEQLALFDKTGIFLSAVMKAPDGQQFGRLNSVWSSDGHYFAFILFDYFTGYGEWRAFNYDTKNTLYIADVQNKKIINTCLSIGMRMAWHPSEHQLTFLNPGNGLKDVLIFDLDTYMLHPIAKHIVGDNQRELGYGTSDSILGWRMD